MKKPEIVLWHAFPPIPDRDSDWAAYRDVEGRYGWGPTPEAAIADLLAWEEMDDEPTDSEIQEYVTEFKPMQEI